MDWAEYTGPMLKPGYRFALMQLASDTDPETGEVVIPQEELAESMDGTRRSANTYLQELKRLKLLKVRKVDPGGGRYPYNVYRLAGLDSEWEVVREKGLTAAVRTPEQRVAALEDHLDRAIKLLEEHGLVNQYDHDEDLVEEIRASNGDQVNILHMDTQERETQESVHVQNLHMGTWSPSDSLSQKGAHVTETGTVATADPIVEFVDAHLEELIGSSSGMFRHRGGAISTFQRHPEELDRWQKKLATFRCVHCDTHKPTKEAKVCRGCGGQRCQDCVYRASICYQRTIRGEDVMAGRTVITGTGTCQFTSWRQYSRQAVLTDDEFGGPER